LAETGTDKMIGQASFSERVRPQMDFSDVLTCSLQGKIILESDTDPAGGKSTVLREHVPNFRSIKSIA